MSSNWRSCPECHRRSSAPNGATTKGTRQHRYYVTRLKPGEDRRSAWRVPVGDIERAVLECTSKFLTQRSAEDLDAEHRGFAVELARHNIPEQRKVLLEEKVRVRLGSSEIAVTVGDEPEQHVRVAGRFARRGSE